MALTGPSILLIDHAALKPRFSNLWELSGFCNRIFIDNKLKIPNLHPVIVKIQGEQFTNLYMVAIETPKEMPPPPFSQISWQPPGQIL